MLAVEIFKQNNCIQKLMNTGRSIGYIYFTDLSKCFPPELTDKNQIEDIICMIEELGIIVKR
jgi:Sigma-70 factor, region 1.1